MQSHFRGPFKREEIVSVINKMADGKSPGFHGITAEEIKVAGKTGIDILQQLCLKIWTHETFPDDWWIEGHHHPHIPKRIQSLDCGNYKGISLLNHAGKIMALVIQRRILNKTEQNLLESQAGFQPGRSAIDQLFILRQIT